ncbi:MAG: hypothetical protein ACI30M_01395 [Muribaculaceae bacterium]
MSKLKKEIVRKLASAFGEGEVISTKDRGSHKESEWSKSFKCENGEDVFGTIQRIFGIRKSARGLFEAATSGDGNEKSRILTLHSSSLLAFLCFNDVANHPITIDDIVYDEVMFEVKNDVINASLGKPSNIDVLLMGENRKKLLFLESKFTEYLSGGKVTLSPHRYEEFYSMLTEKNNFRFSAGYLPVNSKTDKSQKTQYSLYTDKEPSLFLEGIKQAFSHLLGIATGPAKEQTKGNEDYTGSLLENAEEIKFASIVFNCDNDKFEKYNDLYISVFENSDVIIETIKEVVPKRELKLTIVPHLLQYQEVFQANHLSDKVRKFYDQVNDSKIRFSNNI